jgi:2-methylcitrate dehydratase PrpD
VCSALRPHTADRVAERVTVLGHAERLDPFGAAFINAIGRHTMATIDPLPGLLGRR